MVKTAKYRLYFQNGCLGGSFKKWMKISDGFFAEKADCAMTGVFMCPSEPEVVVIVPKRTPGLFYLRAIREDKQVKVSWAFTGDFLVEFPYQPMMSVYDWLVRLKKYLDEAHKQHMSKTFYVVVDSHTMSEAYWNEPIRFYFEPEKVAAAKSLRKDVAGLVTKAKAAPKKRATKAMRKPASAVVKKRPAKKGNSVGSLSR